MKTKLLQNTNEDLEIAAELLQNGELVAFPTETVYGLGADARQEDSVRSIFAAKGRPADNPLIVHISDMGMLDGIVTEVPEIAERLAKAFWPGPLTMVLPKCDAIPEVTSGGLDTVGVRMPSHPAALSLIRMSGCPIAAPSANRSGSPSPTTAKHVMDDMDGRIAAVIDGGLCDVGVESTVICFDDDETIHILRPGLISAEDLEPFAAHVYVDEAVYTQIAADAKVASPGMKYRHYAPHAKIIPVDAPDFAAFAEFVRAHNTEGTYCLLFDSDPEIAGIPCMRYGDSGREQAHFLFLRFRELDEAHAATVYVRMPKKNGTDLSV
ncbi:MAG: threonylcarbamoyl-AMP synthase, partial [Oscillospiraceae bacterium]|nr:threonylcarbamoyl-AMP synthase [Oscillospiraceae bacterium]